MEKKQKKARFTIEEDWLSFYIGIILGLLVMFGVIKYIPW